MKLRVLHEHSKVSSTTNRMCNIYNVLYLCVRMEEVQNIFKVWPYTLRTDKGEVLLKFRLNEPKRIILKIKY